MLIKSSVKAKILSSSGFEVVVAGAVLRLSSGELVKAKELLVDGAVSILLDWVRGACLKEIPANVSVPS